MPSSSPSPDNPHHYLGIDLGTSGIRAILIDASDHIIAEARTDIPAPLRQGEAIEQDPQIWWQGLCEVLQQLANTTSLASVKALAVAGTSGTILLADKQGQPLHAALMYNDSRAHQQLARLTQVAPANNPVHTASSGLAKLLWLSEQSFARHARHALHQADWIAGTLAGRFGFSDPNNALKTGYDAEHGCWPDWMQQLPRISDWLPKVYSQGQEVCTIDPVIADQFGLPPHTRIIAGTTDSTASFIATGARQIGEAVTALGSTLVLKIIAATPITDMRFGIYSQPLGKHWLVGGASNSGGAVLRNYFSNEQMLTLVKQLQPNVPTGLDYYPLLTKGERFPVNDPELLPRLSPKPATDWQFYQGLLEGIATIELNGYRRMAECGAPWPSSIRTTGKGARNSAWTQIRARLLNVPLLPADHSEAAFGAARLARQARTTRSTS